MRMTALTGLCGDDLFTARKERELADKTQYTLIAAKIHDNDAVKFIESGSGKILDCWEHRLWKTTVRTVKQPQLSFIL